MADNNDTLADSAEKAFAAAAAEKAAEKPEATPRQLKLGDAAPLNGAKAGEKNEVVRTPATAIVTKIEPTDGEKAVVAVPVAAVPTKAEAKPVKVVPAAKSKTESKRRAPKLEAVKSVEPAENAAPTVVEAVKAAAAVQATKRTPAEKPVSAKVESSKDNTVAKKAGKTTEEFTGKVQEAVKDAQARAKAAFEKNKERLSEVGEFTKGSIEALRESGKILATGVKNLGKTYVEATKSNVTTMRADVKELRGVRSPKQFVKLQGTMVRKYLDHAVATNSKQGEVVRKLASEAIKPISGRVTLAVEKVKKAA